MAGLAVSIGASGLLITGQSAHSALATESIKKPILSTVAAPMEAVPNSPAIPVEKMGEPITLTGNVNAILTNSQAKDSLAQLRSEESNNSSATSNFAESSIQNLQTEVEKLREKYPAKQTGSQATSIVVTNSAAVAVPVLAPASGQIPSGANNSQPLTQVSPVAPAAALQPLATVPMDADLSAPFQFLGGQQVSPELPPLAAGDIYLPKALTAFRGYIWPAKGILTSPFGWRWGHIHPGIDIAAPIGTPIFAAAAGVVATAGWNSGGYGNLVDVRHADGSLTRYGHNSRILVQVGQQIAQGQEIAEMGSTGFSTGPHCHFEVHPAGHGAVNPIAYLPRR